MVEILKLFIEKPENIRRNSINLIKILLIVIIASRTYEYLYGEFTPILIGDKNYWIDMYHFFVSGNAFIVVAIFFFLKFIFWEFAPSIFFALLHLLAKTFKIKPDPLFDNYILKTFLKHFKILKFNNNRLKKTTPGVNFVFALNFLKKKKKENIHKEMTAIKETYISELFNLYFIFAIVYFFILEEYQLTIISFAIAIGFLLFFIVLLGLEFYFYLIDKNYEKILETLLYMNQIHITNTFLNNYDIKSLEVYNKNPASDDYELQINEVNYYLMHYFEGHKTIIYLNKLKNKKPNSKILLITSTKIKPLLLNELHKHAVEVIHLKKEKRFIKDMENILFKKN